MKSMFLMVVAMVSLMGCGVWDHPPCDSCTTCDPRSGCTKSTCGESKIFITHESNTVDKTNDFLGGYICVKSNLPDLSYLIDDDQNVDNDPGDKTPPVERFTDPIKCHLWAEGSYTIVFSSQLGYDDAPPVKDLPLEEGDKYTVNAQFAPQ